MARRRLFLQRVVAVTLGDVQLDTWRDHAEAAKYWQNEFEEMEKNGCHLGGSDLLLYKRCRTGITAWRI